MASLTPFRMAAVGLTRVVAPSTIRSSSLAVRQRRAGIHHSAALRYSPPYKDDQDRESLKPKAHEYSQNDDQAAHSDAAFDPSKTRPEAEGAQAQNQDGAAGAALRDSPTDKETAEAGRGKAEDKPGEGKGKASRGGNAPKAGKL